MLGRDSKTVIDDPVLFGKEWQVRDNEMGLFGTARVPQFPEECIMPGEGSSINGFKRRRLGQSSVTKQAAEKACDWWGPEVKERCVYDVLALGDLEIAEAGP